MTIESAGWTLGTGGATVAGGTLGGTATVSGAVTVEADGTLTAGEADGTGTLTLAGGLAMAEGSTLKIQVAGAAADRVLLSGGSVAVTAPITVDVETLEAPMAPQYPILDWSGATSGAAELADFELGEGADTYYLVVQNDTLFLRTLVSKTTLIMVR